MGYLKLWVSYAILFAVLATAEEKSGKGRPYEFGYVIEGQQHRYEKRDENGVITGDFGFVTGDGVYHATQFAADETGKFRITARRTLKIGLPGQPGSIPIPRDLFLRSDYFKLRDIKTSDTATCSDCLVQKKPKPSVTEPKPLVKMTVKQKSDTLERTMTLEVVKLPSPKRVDPTPADVKRKEFAPVVHPPDAINPVNLFKPFVRKSETDSKSPTRSPEAKPKSFIPTSDNGGNIVEPPKSVAIPDSKILKLTIDTETQPKPFTLTDSSRAGKSFNVNPPSETVPATESPILFIQPISKPKSSTTQISGKAQTAVKTQTQGTLGQNDLPQLKPVTKFIPETVPVIKGSAENVPVLEKGIVPTPFDPAHTHAAQFKVDHGKAQTSSEGKNSVVLEDIPSLVSDSPVNTKVHQTKPSKVDSEFVNLVEPESRKSLEQVPHLPLKPVVVELHTKSLKPSLESLTFSSESPSPTQLPTLSISSSPRDSGESEETLDDGDGHEIIPPSISQYETSRQRPLTPSRKQILSTNLPAKPSTSVAGLVTPHKTEDADDDSLTHQTSEDGENGVNKAPDFEETKSPPRSGTEEPKDTLQKRPQILREKDKIKDSGKSSSKSESTKPETPPFKKPLVVAQVDSSKQPKLSFRKPQLSEDQGDNELFDSVKPKSSPKSDFPTQEIPSFTKPLSLQEEDNIKVYVPEEPITQPEVLSFEKPRTHADSRGPIHEEAKSSPESEITRTDAPLFKKPLLLDSSKDYEKSSPKLSIKVPKDQEDSQLSDSEGPKSSPKSEIAKQEVPSFKQPLVHGEQEPKSSSKSRITEPEGHAFKKPLVPTEEYNRKSVEKSSSKSGVTNPDDPEEDDSKGLVLKDPEFSPESEITRPEVPSFRKPFVPKVQDTRKEYEKSSSKSGVTRPGLPSFKKPLTTRVQDTTKTHEISSPELVITKPEVFFTKSTTSGEQDSGEATYSEEPKSPELGITKSISKPEITRSEVPSFRKPLVPRLQDSSKEYEKSLSKSGVTKPDAPSFKPPHVVSEKDDIRGHVLKEPNLSPESGITRPGVPSFKKPLIPRVKDTTKPHEISSPESATKKPKVPFTQGTAPDGQNDSETPYSEEPKSPELVTTKSISKPEITRSEVPSFRKPFVPKVQDTRKEYEKSSSKSGVTKPDAPSFKTEEDDSRGHVLKEPELSPGSGTTRPGVPSFKKPLIPRVKDTTKTHEISSPESATTKPKVRFTQGTAPDGQNDSETPYSEEPETPELVTTKSILKPEITRSEVPSFRKPFVPKVQDTRKEYEKPSSKSGVTKGLAPGEQTDSEAPYSEDNSEIPVSEEPTSPLELGITKPKVPSFKKPGVLRKQDDSKVHVSLESKLPSKPEVPSFRKPLVPRVQDSSKGYEKSSSKSEVSKPDASHVVPEEDDKEDLDHSPPVAPAIKKPLVIGEHDIIKLPLSEEPKYSPKAAIIKPDVTSFKKPQVVQEEDNSQDLQKSAPQSEIKRPEVPSFRKPLKPRVQDNREGVPSFKKPLIPRDDYDSKVSQEPKSSPEPRLTRPEVPSFKKPLLPQGDDNRKSLEKLSPKSGIEGLKVKDDCQIRISEEPTPPKSTRPDIPSFRKPLTPREGAAVPVTPPDGGALDLFSYEETTTGSLPRTGSDRMQSPKEDQTISSVRGTAHSSSQKPTTGVSSLNDSVPRRKGMRRKIIKRPGSSRQTGKNSVPPLLEDALTDTVTPKPVRLNFDTEIDQTQARKTNIGVSKLEISSLPEKETSKKRTKTPSSSPKITDKIIGVGLPKPAVTKTYNTPATTASIGVGQSHDIHKPVVSIPSTGQIQDSSPVAGDDSTTIPTPTSTIANLRPLPSRRPKVFQVPGISKAHVGRVRPSSPEIKDVLTTMLVQKPTVTEGSQTPSTETSLGAHDLPQDVVELEVPSPVHDALSAQNKKPKDDVSELGVSLSPEKADQRIVKAPPLVFKDILTTVAEPNPTIGVSQPHTKKPRIEEFEIQIPKSSGKSKPEKVGQTRKTRVKGRLSPTRSSIKGVSTTDKTSEGLKTLRIEMDSLTPRDRIVAYVTEVPVKVDMTVRGSRKEIDNFVTLSAPKHVPETATKPSRIHMSGNSRETQLPSSETQTPSSFPIPIRPLEHNHDDRDPSNIVSGRREGKELTIEKTPFVDGNTNKIHSQISNSDTQSTIIPTLISGTLQDSKTRVTGHPTQVPRPHAPQKVTGTLESGVKVPSIPKSDSTKSPVTFDKIDIAKPKPTPTNVTSTFPIKSSPTPSQNIPINLTRDRDQATSTPVVQAPTLKPLTVEQSSALPPGPRDTEETPYVPTPAPKQGTTSSERDSRKLFQVPSGDLQKLSLEDQTVLPGVDVRLSFGGTDTQQPTKGPQRSQFGVVKTEASYTQKPIKLDSAHKGPKVAPALVQRVPDTFSQPKAVKIEVTTLPAPVVPAEQPDLSSRDPEPARIPQPTPPTRIPSLPSRITPTTDEKLVPKSQVFIPKSSVESTPRQFEPTLVPVTQTPEVYTTHKPDTPQEQVLPGRSQLTRPSAHLPPIKPAKEATFAPKSQVITALTGKTPSVPKPAVKLTTGQFESTQAPVTQAPEGYTTHKTETPQTEGVTGTGRPSAHLASVKQTEDGKFVPRPQVSNTTSAKTPSARKPSVQLTPRQFEPVRVTQTPQEYRTYTTGTPQIQGLSGTGPSVKPTQDKKFVSKSHVSKPKPQQFEPVTLTHPPEGHPAHKTDTPHAQSLPGTAQPTRPAAHLPAPKPAPAPKLVSGTPHTAPLPAPDARGPVHSTHPTQTFTEAPIQLPTTGFKSDLKNVEIKSVSGDSGTSKPASGSRSPSSKVPPTASLGFRPSTGGKPTEAQKPPVKPQLLDVGVQTSRGSPSTPKVPLQAKTVPQAGGTLVDSTGRRPAQQTKTQSDRQPVSKPGTFSEGTPRVSKPKITDSPQTIGLDTRFSLEDDSGKRQQRPKPVSITPLATGDRQGRKGFGDEKPSTGSGRVSEGASRGSVRHRTSSLGGILYRFNYTAGYHGHHEQGDTTGNKDGGYEFIGRDGVLRRVDYVANEFGYQPHVSQHTVGAERTPKEETEKEAGLKGYEFKWFNPE